MFFPLQRMNASALWGKTFSMEKLFPNLSTTYKKKICSVWPHAPWSLCVGCTNPRKCVPQRPYIPTHWASTHVPPELPQTSAMRGTGARVHSGPATERSYTPQSAREGGREGRGQCRAIKQPSVSRPVTLQEERWPSCSALGALGAWTVLTLESQNTHSGTAGCSHPAASVFWGSCSSPFLLPSLIN